MDASPGIGAERQHHRFGSFFDDPFACDQKSVDQGHVRPLQAQKLAEAKAGEADTLDWVLRIREAGAWCTIAL